jgi:ankyrin repeat protein
VPNELLLQIISDIDSARDLFHFALACRTFYRLAINRLDKRIIRLDRRIRYYRYERPDGIQSLLGSAVENNNIDSTRRLLDLGLDVDSPCRVHEFKIRTNTYCSSAPLTWAVKHGNVELVRLLIQRGADVNATGFDYSEVYKLCWAPICWAVWADNQKLLDILIAAGADVLHGAKKGWRNCVPPLHVAAQMGNVKMVAKLLEAGADPAPPTRPELHDKPVLRDVWDLDCLKLLLQSGAKASGGIGWQISPLAFAFEIKNPVDKTTPEFFEVVKLLLENGADPNRIDSELWTPLMNVLQFDLPWSLAELLVKHGADVNYPNNCYETPLHLCSAMAPERPERVKWLIEHGAKVNYKGSDHDTPLDWAVFANFQDIAKLLKENGAVPGDPEYIEDAVSSALREIESLKKQAAEGTFKDPLAGLPAEMKGGVRAYIARDAHGRDYYTESIPEYVSDDE